MVMLALVSSLGLTTASATTTILNRSLEQAGQTAAPDCWRQDGYGTNSSRFARTSDAHSGSWAGNVTISSYTSGARRLVVDRADRCSLNVTPGQRYTVSGWSKLTGTAQWVLFTRNATTGAWSWQESGTFAPASNGWSHSAYTSKPIPAGVDRVSFGLALQSKGSLTVDDMDFARAGSTPTPTATGTPTATATPSPTGHTWYVSRRGSNADGKSWSSAWSELSAINWAAVQPGDTVLIDGGSSRCASAYDFTTTRPGVSCGMTYSTTLTVGRSGTSAAPVTIRRATEPGRDGTVVLFGGRDVPLPYCHQSSYTAPAGRSRLVDLNGQSYVTLDGVARSGIMAYGAQNGVAFGSDSANHITLRNLEIFDNGVPTTISNGYNSDGENITLRGHHLTFDRLLVHDGGQDDFQDQTHANGTLHDLTFQNSWIYFARENPQYPGYSFNEPQSTGCTHADGIQIYSGGQQSAITVDHMLFGPGGNQGFYPGDSGTGAKYDNVSITNTLFLASASHNVMTDLAVSGWTMDHNTIYAPQGGSEVPANGPMRLTNTIKYGGYWSAPGGTWTASGNVSYGGDPIPGSTSTNPGFVGPMPTSSPPRFSQLRASNFTPTCAACSTAGAPLHKVGDILSRIDALNQ
ncbi:hypothetical protein KRR39_07305 [Nocardioides panacis]|uniref:CBM-cenC domain-containing protein n=1 Tax=Nocardioides panacis TaxID=2849501 RepID=A0A975T104_9ACTN|nr:hypothetical protein [Nocardioides panacis]QWZ09551.1 hypothetical protein KRR39_07305 [Nocardioides panacis]